MASVDDDRFRDPGTQYEHEEPWLSLRSREKRRSTGQIGLTHQMTRCGSLRACFRNWLRELDWAK